MWALGPEPGVPDPPPPWLDASIPSSERVLPNWVVIKAKQRGYVKCLLAAAL